MQVKPGTLWWSGNSKRFRVIDTAVIEEREWVYYKEESSISDSKEYSCYLESFVLRFSQLLE